MRLGQYQITVAFWPTLITLPDKDSPLSYSQSGFSSFWLDEGGVDDIQTYTDMNDKSESI